MALYPYYYNAKTERFACVIVVQPLSITRTLPGGGGVALATRAIAAPIVSDQTWLKNAYPIVTYFDRNPWGAVLPSGGRGGYSETRRGKGIYAHLYKQCGPAQYTDKHWHCRMPCGTDRWHGDCRKGFEQRVQRHGYARA